MPSATSSSRTTAPSTRSRRPTTAWPATTTACPTSRPPATTPASTSYAARSRPSRPRRPSTTARQRPGTRSSSGTASSWRWRTPASRAAWCRVIDSALHGMRQVFDLMSTEGSRGPRARRRPARGRPRRRPGLPRHARRRGRPRPGVGVGAVRQGRRADPRLDRRDGRERRLLRRPGRALRPRPASWPTGCASTPARPPVPSPTSGSSCPTSSSRRAATRRPWVASTTR